ncbi:type II secretion system F family protein [Pseudotabrizicola sediminis]|nr:type II secretion system F family protein [Pseudotabrizicola sediminis]
MTRLTEFDWSSLVYVGVFLGVLMTFEGIRQLVSRSESLSEARNRRMRMIAAGTSTEELLRLLKPGRERWQLQGLPFFGTLPADLRKAGLMIRPGLFMMLAGGGAAVLALATSTALPAWLAAGPALLLCIVAPVIWVRVLRDRRMAALVAQLPEALDLMARGLTVGHPLNATIASVASDMKDPVATEFGVMIDQISYGDDLVDAVMDLAERTGLEDARYLAVAVAIQHGTGGNLARVLDTLAKVIRDRMAMRRRIKAISAEGRLTSIFLSCLPLVILGATSITAPGYYVDVSGDPLFRPFAIVVAVLVVANFLIMRRLVNFRI